MNTTAGEVKGEKGKVEIEQWTMMASIREHAEAGKTG